MTAPELRAAIVYFVGVTLAICAASKMPAGDAEWSDAVPLFVAGCVLAMGATFRWRKIRARIAADAPVASTPDEDPFALLAALIPAASTLVERQSDLDAPSLQSEVDTLLDTYVLPFAEVRQRVIDRVGMVAGAEVLVTMAYGERMLNRVWSAAADGHLPEARSCLPEAVDALAEAQQLAEKALKTLG